MIGELLQRVNRELGTTIIFTTHDRLQAAALAQKTLVLENGRLVPTTYENSYACSLVSGEDGGWQCLLHDRVQLSFPKGSGVMPQGSGRVTIDPGRMHLAQNAKELPAGHAVVPGRVVLLMEEGRNIRVVVDVGVLMVVLLPEAVYHAVAPTVGSPVQLAIPEAACTFLL